MDFRFAEDDGKLVIAFCGDLDNASVPEAEKYMERVYMYDDCDLILDCSRLNYISSKGLRLLIDIYKHFRNCGHHSYIRNMNKMVKDVLYIGGFLSFYEEIG